MKQTPSKPTAVLLMAYGSPENLSEVEPYYIHIRKGVRPPEALIKNLQDRYAKVGGKTPLHQITKDQADRLQRMLDEKNGKGAFKVFVGMKHWHPYIKDVLQEIKKEGIEEVIALALAPHYSKISIGGYQTALHEAASGADVKLIESWHTNSYLIDCIVEQLHDALAGFTEGTKPHVIFTAHSLPERILTWNDPYPAQLAGTSRFVAERAGLKAKGIEWSFAFQSAGMTGEPWLGPDINDALLSLKKEGKKDILICPIGFVSDNLEIVYDLDIESQELAAREGINLRRTSLRNAHPVFIEAIYDEVTKAAQAKKKLSICSIIRSIWRRS